MNVFIGLDVSLKDTAVCVLTEKGDILKGFKDLLALGWIDSMPKLFGVQAEGSNYLVDAWGNGNHLKDCPARPASTIADSLQAELPKDRVKAMNAVVETEGAFVQVSDLEILQAMKTYSQSLTEK